MSGSDHEPSDAPIEAAQQMRAATQRLRDKGWMVSPLTQPVIVEPAADAEQVDS